ncbi:SDR family NAD(P)-dependent oxidoreductase [Haliangium ochraceum]|uniref:Short-chain dehydrogenase/reductase SDR n=1 Tax=Haliangium ochraceum (strain DSM 14365 / JCM 11303 / SMP-2) TaxID=502025 RepID=D0LIT2_HALO1|nr:SDR family NAD(P)-dependent oxidoreductase [Haliangium ochraceum]ACY12961.1 short-chain dehydrogenase/reductase SDR [Haliangium ochraceum DSM 14365]
MPTALIIGSSDGIGLALVRALLARGYQVAGLSRSPLPAERVGDGAERYQHLALDVRDPAYRAHVAELCQRLGALDLCIYAAGIGDSLALDQLDENAHLAGERPVFAVNLMGLVDCIEVVLPRMLARGRGHIIGLSSQADGFPDGGAPSYGASKAGMSAYLERLALAVRARGVAVTNVRLGFVDTKMAKADVRPFLITPEAAAERILRCLRRKPIRVTHPWRMAALLWLVAWPGRLRIWLS